MAQASSFESLESAPQWTPAWEEAVRAFYCKVEARTGLWFDTRLGRQWRALEPRQRRALVLIAMANSKRGSVGRMVDEGTELLLTVTQYFLSQAKVELYTDSRRDPRKRVSSGRRTEESLRVCLQRQRLTQRASIASYAAYKASSIARATKAPEPVKIEESSPWSG
ncbi:hypothetical protein NM688_g4833 [Phlebia brevispora]|uniref:Uncharacterized protein n=1 Tax=Phlebia brevispora TaxID=194682 RepID=A0ACC1T1Z4_9APHY|nr:hypothetical protein NM688_g4833 [Phlebia brevispora]